METISGYIKLIAGIFITIAVIVGGVMYFNQSQESGSGSIEKIGSINKQFSEADKTIYEGARVSGAVVTKQIKDYGDELSATFTVTVKTLKGSTTGTVYNAKTTTFPAKGANEYINPDGKFLGSVTYDANKVISGIVFTQVVN